MDETISWEPVRHMVGRLLAGRTTHIIAGTPEWEALPDDHPEKYIALLVAASRWALETEMRRLDEERLRRQLALKEATLDLAQEVDWQRVAKYIADRDAFHREHPDLKRKIA